MQGTFDDGGTAFGSFDYDAATNMFSAIDVTTTGGSIRPGAHYTLYDPCCGALPNFLAFVTGTGDLTGTPLLAVYVFTAGLTDAGGTFDLQLPPTGAWGEYTCSNADCSGIVQQDPSIQNFTSGFVSSVPAVPEPASMVMLGVGWLAMAGVRRRK